MNWSMCAGAVTSTSFQLLPERRSVEAFRPDDLSVEVAEGLLALAHKADPRVALHTRDRQKTRSVSRPRPTVVLAGRPAGA